MTIRVATAWSVHFYTALGGICGVFALFFAAQNDIQMAYLLLVLQMLIDATDGLLARRFKVKEVLPQFDGAMLDNVIDIFTYAWIPLFIILDQQLLPHPAWIIFPTFAALYAYGQSNMKNEEGYFIGFPTYWNVVALYLYWLRPVDWLAVLIVIVPAILSFIPTRYLYPSKGVAFWKTAWVLCGFWFLLVLYLLSQEFPNQILVLVSLLFPLWYMGMSFYVEWRERTKVRTV
jgi:phosphatidylcholine synthase